MKSLLILLLAIVTLYATQAIQKELEFTQPDGTTFKGYLRGDSTLHWIESYGEIIVNNPKDKYYYKAVVDAEKGIIPSAQKVIPINSALNAKNNKFREKAVLVNSALNAKSVKAPISKRNKEVLQILYRKLREQDAPR